MRAAAASRLAALCRALAGLHGRAGLPAPDGAGARALQGVPAAGSRPSPSRPPADAPWWSIYGDPVLDGLERQVDISNQTLKAARPPTRQARAMVDEAARRPLPDPGGSARTAHPTERGRDRGRRRRNRPPAVGTVRAELATVSARRAPAGTRTSGARSGARSRAAVATAQAERGRSGRRAAVGPGDARHRLFRAARRTTSRSACYDDDGRGLRARCHDHAQPVQGRRGRADPT